MAFSVKVGTITLPIVTGDFAVTGVGFQPKAVILFGHNRQADGYGTQFRRWVSAFTGTSQQWSAATGDDNAAATMNAGRYPVDNRCLLTVGSGTPGVDSEATLVSLDSDGWTMNFSNAPANAHIVNYIAIGGTDVTNAKAGTFTPSAGTGNKSTTDPGFQPDAVFLVAQGGAVGGALATAILSVGGFDKDGNEWASVYRSEDAAADSNVAVAQRSDRCVLILDEATAAYDGEFEYVSVDTNGFTINALTGLAQPIFYLAIKGGGHRFGVDTQRTSTGTKDTTTTGVNPLAVLLASVNAAASSSIDSTQLRSSLGAGDGTTEGSVWGQSADAAATSDTDQRQISTKAIGMSTQASTTNAEADLSLLTGGFRLDWTTADGTAREFGYWAMGDAAASTQTVVPDQVGTSASVGNPTLAHVVEPGQVGTSASVGSPTLAYEVQPSQVGTSADVGQPTVSPGPVTVVPDAVASSASVGEPSVQQVQTVEPQQVASSADVGQPTVAPGPVTVEPQQVASSASVGSPAAVYDQVVVPQQVGTSASVGNPGVGLSAQGIIPVQVESSAEVGQPTVGLLRSPLVGRPGFRPVELTVRLLAPGGRWLVVGTDLSRGIVHEDLVYSHRDGSPETCGFLLRRDPSRAWPDLAAFNRCVIEAGGVDVWSGRVREAPGSAGSGSDTVTMQGQGWRYHGDDDLVCRGYVRQRLEGGVDVRSVESSPSAWPATLLVNMEGPRITIGWANGTPWVNATGVGVRWDLGEHHPGARGAAMDCLGVNTNAFFTVYLRGHHTPDAITALAFDQSDAANVSHTTISAVEGSPTTIGGDFPSGDSYRYVTAFLYITGPGGTTAFDHLLKILRLIVWSDVSYEASGQSLLNADDVVRDVVDAMPLLVQSDSEVEATSFAIPDFWPQRSSPNDLMAAVNAYHDHHLGVDVDRRLFFRPRPDVPVLETGPWSGAEFSDGSSGSGDDVYSKAIVQALGVDGNDVELVRYSADAAPDKAQLVDAGGVSNPGFETNTTGWTTVTGTLTRVTSGTPYAGTAHAQLDADANAFGEVTTTLSNLEVGYVYAARFRYKNAGGAPVPILDVGATVESGGAVIGRMPTDETAGNGTPAYLMGQVSFVAVATTATLRINTRTDAGLQPTAYIDGVQVLRVETSVVDRNGFTRAARMPLAATLTPAAAEAVTDVWLRERLRTPFKGSLTVVGHAGVRMVKGGAAVPPHLLPLYTDRLIRLATMEDPDTGDWGRVGTVRSASYSHRAGTCTVEIDSERHRVEALLERLAVVTGQVG